MSTKYVLNDPIELVPAVLADRMYKTLKHGKRTIDVMNVTCVVEAISPTVRRVITHTPINLVKYVGPATPTSDGVVFRRYIWPAVPSLTTDAAYVEFTHKATVGAVPVAVTTLSDYTARRVSASTPYAVGSIDGSNKYGMAVIPSNNGYVVVSDGSGYTPNDMLVVSGEYLTVGIASGGIPKIRLYKKNGVNYDLTSHTISSAPAAAQGVYLRNKLTADSFAGFVASGYEYHRYTRASTTSTSWAAQNITSSHKPATMTDAFSGRAAITETDAHDPVNFYPAARTDVYTHSAWTTTQTHPTAYMTQIPVGAVGATDEFVTFVQKYAETRTVSSGPKVLTTVYSSGWTGVTTHTEVASVSHTCSHELSVNGVVFKTLTGSFVMEKEVSTVGGVGTDTCVVTVEGAALVDRSIYSPTITTYVVAVTVADVQVDSVTVLNDKLLIVVTRREAPFQTGASSTTFTSRVKKTLYIVSFAGALVEEITLSDVAGEASDANQFAWDYGSAYDSITFPNATTSVKTWNAVAASSYDRYAGTLIAPFNKSESTGGQAVVHTLSAADPPSYWVRTKADGTHAVTKVGNVSADFTSFVPF